MRAQCGVKGALGAKCLHLPKPVLSERPVGLLKLNTCVHPSGFQPGTHSLGPPCSLPAVKKYEGGDRSKDALAKFVRENCGKCGKAKPAEAEADAEEEEEEEEKDEL